MKRTLLFILATLPFLGVAQNQIVYPDTLSGTTFNLNMHTDSVQFLPGTKTFTNAFNQYSYLGPTLLLNKGDVVTMNVTDNVNDTTTLHWHGLHVPAMADGGPHTYILAGDTWSPSFTVMNNASTFWYHPHTHMKTGQQAMRGAAGMIIVRDSIEATLDLPRRYGIDDFPIVVQSQQFDSANQVMWRGMQDSILLVNGTQNPMTVFPSQVVRMRLLNASQERNFNFGFTGNRSFYVIGNDGGLLNAPVSVNRIRLSPGERAEILVDLSALSGQTLYLMSYASEFPMGVQGGTPMPGMGSSMDSPINGIDFNILQINVGAPTVNPVTTIPNSLVSVTPWTPAQSNISRNIIITAQNMMSMDGPFYFNGQLFDMNRIDYTIPLDNIEIWSITNQTMVAHPFHIHDVQFFVLDRDGTAAQPQEKGYKDVVMIAPQETVRFITKFEDFADAMMPYMYHCHILMHEDDGMMGQFVVVPNPNSIKENITSTEISVYPNPVAGNELNVNIKHPLSNNVSYSITNMLGQEIIHSTAIMENNTMKINIASLTQGNYFIKIINNEMSAVGKFSVTR
jgi:bilirubin oxidase